MDITLTATVENYVRRLVDSGAYTSPESAVNSLVAKIASERDLNLRLPSPFVDPEAVEDIPDFPRGQGTLLTPILSRVPRQPDLVGL
jgi:hypothetical protein